MGAEWGLGEWGAGALHEEALADRMDEICCELWAARHAAIHRPAHTVATTTITAQTPPQTPTTATATTSAVDAGALGAGMRLLARSLPLREGALLQYVQSTLLGEQRATGVREQGPGMGVGQGGQGMGQGWVHAELPSLTHFREQTRMEIEAGSNAVADRVLARLLVGEVEELGKLFDLQAFK
ncbi:hypothetical protein B484DRAFT_445547 [Ochromonadaceae sp. CCMP2298]|nr:hypothetical protein B484DRAFT_445547 [Ochromonadaceae sp. CCMP2298]